MSTLDWPNPEPKQKHIELQDGDLKSRLVIVGDVHGCLDELKELLVKCAYDPNDTTLILVGDLVNKGPYSAETVSYVRQLGAHCVRGNHDESALTCALKIEHKSARNYEYASHFTSEDIAWLQDLPYTITIPSMKITVVHAGLVPGVSYESQTYENMVTIRNVYTESAEDGPARWMGTSKGGVGEAWAKVWSEPPQSEADHRPHVYFGHDAKRGLQQHAYATGLDTGCCYGRQLTAIILPSRELVHVDALRMYEVPNV